MKKIIDYLKYQYYLLRTYPKRRMFPKYKILSIEETIREVVEKKKSISRLGDADFLLLIDERDVSYQTKDPRLVQKLREVLLSREENFICAIAEPIVRRNGLTQGAHAHWINFINKYGERLSSFMPVDKEYGNANITRYYIDLLDVNFAEKTISSLKKIWDKQNLIIFEGAYSRLGVGNDLFDNSTSMKRILCPTTNAFRVYDAILNYFEENGDKSILYLFSLGPTASVLCYELSKKGFWCVDIGNVDMEYMWFKAKAQSKISIRGRFHVETDNQESSELLPEEKELYETSIIMTLGI